MNISGPLRRFRFAAALVVVAPVALAQSDAATGSPKPFTVMTDAQISKMLGAIGDVKSLRVEIYRDQLEGPFARRVDNSAFTKLCRIDDPDDREKIVRWISELRPLQPIVPAGNDPMSMMLYGGYGPFVLDVVFRRGRHEVFSGTFSLPGFDDKSPRKVSIGYFPDNRLGSFAVDPIVKIDRYIESSGLGNCVDRFR